MSNPTLAAVGNDPEVGAEIAETAVNAVANFLSNAVDTAVDVVNHVDQEFNEFLEDDDHIVHQVLTIQQQVLNPGPAYPGPDPDDSYMEISAEQAVHDDAVLDPFDPGSQVEATINFINCAIACEHEGSDPPPSGGGGGGGGPIYITP
ncbi:MAG: hypothetical protein F4Y97_08265 [Dehalococcoidia bacterium]|nr:hypothetical protein [Dehalococcoidia bacterium]